MPHFANTGVNARLKAKKAECFNNRSLRAGNSTLFARRNFDKSEASDKLAALPRSSLMRRILCLVFLWLLVSMLPAGQAQTRIAIRAQRLIDGKSEKPLENVLIQVEGDKIMSVTTDARAPGGVRVVDLGNATVLPGFIDAHTSAVAR